MEFQRLVGIDLGGRTTGRTALAWLALPDLQVHLLPAAELHVRLRGQVDETAFVALVQALAPDLVALDAPLSLPDVTQPDYLRRPADVALQALSPWASQMGALTARALHLRHRLQPVPCIEVYPKTVVQQLGLPGRGYKRDPAQLARILQAVVAAYGFVLPPALQAGLTDPAAEHSVDAVLALAAAWHRAMGRYRLAPGTTDFVLPA